MCHTPGSGSSYLSKTMAQRTQSVLVYSIHVSQGSAATRFGCGGIFNDSYVVNFPVSQPVKEFRKSAEN